MDPEERAEPGAEAIARVGQQKVKGIAAEAALALAVNDQAMMIRKERRRKREQMKIQVFAEDDAIGRLVAGEDPNFLGAPFIWVQIGHVVLLSTAVFAAAVSGQDIEFALFDLGPDTVNAVVTGIKITVAMNILVAANLVYSELQIGEERLVSAFGWGLKALLLGGVASWQWWGRIKRAEKAAKNPLAKPI